MQENIFDPAGMTQSYYIGNEKNACHAYEYDRDRGDSEESSGDRPEGPHNWYEYDYGEETFFGTRPDGGCIYHTGDNGGFKILAARYPKKNTFVLVFAARTDWDRYELKSQIEKLYSLLD